MGLRYIGVLGVAIFALITAQSAKGVYFSPGGIGHALIYPYYSAQSAEGGAMNTYITVSNAFGGPTTVRVRLREGRNGREVVSFNLRLGLAETWAGAVVPTASGARLITRSTSCTEPAFEAAGDGSSYLDLSSQAYSGSAADGMGVELERVREGYVEAFAMSELFSPGIPFTCGDFQSGTMLLDELTLDGGIAGTLSLINVATEWSLRRRLCTIGSP